MKDSPKGKKNYENIWCGDNPRGNEFKTNRGRLSYTKCNLGNGLIEFEVSIQGIRVCNFTISENSQISNQKIYEIANRKLQFLDEFGYK